VSTGAQAWTLGYGESVGAVGVEGWHGEREKATGHSAAPWYQGERGKKGDTWRTARWRR
jgi:hypothetical protein